MMSPHSRRYLCLLLKHRYYWSRTVDTRRGRVGTTGPDSEGWGRPLEGRDPGKRGPVGVVSRPSPSTPLPPTS